MNSKRPLKTLQSCFVILLVVLHSNLCFSEENIPETGKPLDSITLQLKWRHQFQFAGYYAALDKGFYRELGLDVKIIEATAEGTSTNQVINGKADFGIAMSDLVDLRAAGEPVVVLASIFQHSPLIILTLKKSGIENIHDLKRKKISLEPHSEQILSYLESEGLPLDELVISSHDHDIDKLISGEVDAMSAYSTDEPFILSNRKIEYRTFSPLAGGIDFYGDTLFTTEKQVKEHPERVAAFLAASLKGWKYALDNTEEIVDLILSNYTTRHSREHLLFEAQRTKRLIMADVVELGYMNPGRWQHIVNSYQKLDLIPNTFSLKGFIYERNPAPDIRWIYYSFFGIVVIAGLAFLLVGRFYKTNQLLKWEITERKLAEGRTVTSEKRYRELYENSPLGYQSLDDEGYFIESNTSLCWLLGYERKEVVGRWFGDFLTEESAEKFRRNFPRFKAKGEVRAAPFDMVTKDKQVISVEIDGRIGHNEQGDFKQTHCVIQDVTTRKQLSDELDKHRHHLEQLVEKRTAQLSSSQQRAEAANQAKSEFLANMSHEIRTPMNAITGLTHMLQQGDLNADQAQQLTKIETSTRHLLSVINNILDISKIEAGKLVLEHTDFHLDAIFEQLQSMFKEQLDSTGLNFEFDSVEVPRWLRGDVTRLHQALLNYVGNAIKFTEHGTISLRAIKLEEDDSGTLVRFEVRDTGIGIAADKLTGLFESFQQADTSNTRKYGGTGLGLTITRRLAQLMGGEAGVESELGRGSTFWFTARLKAGHGEMPSTAPAESTATGLLPHHRGARVLLVEDNAINLEVAVALLSRAGLELDTAENGREAVSMVRSNDYDLILMDIQMPEMDGLEATRLIRSMAGKESLPILAMTANVFEEDRKECRETGMNDFVAKPIDVDTMFNTLAKWLPKQDIANPVETSQD